MKTYVLIPASWSVDGLEDVYVLIGRSEELTKACKTGKAALTVFPALRSVAVDYFLCWIVEKVPYNDDETCEFEPKDIDFTLTFEIDGEDGFDDCTVRSVNGVNLQGLHMNRKGVWAMFYEKHSGYEGGSTLVDFVTLVEGDIS